MNLEIESRFLPWRLSVMPVGSYYQVWERKKPGGPSSVYMLLGLATAAHGEAKANLTMTWGDSGWESLAKGIGCFAS